MHNLATIARRFGYDFDGAGFDVGLARITPIDRSEELAVGTSHCITAAALHRSRIGRVLFRQAVEGRLTLAVSPQELSRLIAVIERITE